jgi:flagellar biosynthesis protein FlhF
METKAYFANSLQAAMEVARKELGADALLVQSGPASDDERAFGRLKVMFAWDPSARPGEKPAPAPAVPVRRAEGGLDEIRREISALRAAIQGPPPGPAGVVKAISEVDDSIVQTLCDTGMSTDLAREIATAAKRGQTDNGVVRELMARIPSGEFEPLQADESRTLAFIGPPGRGKTTSLIKIAVRYGVGTGTPVRIYSAGAHGVGGAEQMARYAAILGVPFQSIESFDNLHLALNGDRWKGLILIDTPGAVASDRQEMEAMTRFFARRPAIQRHMVLRADARSADMQSMVSRFKAIQPSRLFFTGVDEVQGLGAAAEIMIRGGIPSAFFGTGPRIPEDLDQVNVETLARSLWKANRRAAAAA